MTADPRPGSVAASVAAELPGIGLWELTVAADLARRPEPEIRARLAQLAGRVTGAVAVEARHDEIVHAYRVCFRHVGLDPDVERTPYEGALLERLRSGGFASRDVLSDALLLALLDTKVAVTAFAEDRLTGPLRLDAAPKLVLADDARVVAPLFGAPRADVAPARATTALRLVAVTPPGVAVLPAWEALDRVAELVAP